MKKLLLIIVALALAGCGDRQPIWILRYTPTTDAERRAVAEHVEKTVGGAVRKLCGDDQDWEDAINAAHEQARRSLCRPTMWEHAYDGFWRETGRWRYTEEAKLEKP